MSTKTPPKPPSKSSKKQEDEVLKMQETQLKTPEIAVEAVLIDADLAGYCPIRADVLIPKQAKRNLKRLALTLDVTEERLADGTLVQNRVSKAIAWLIERFSDEIEKSESGNS